MAIGDDFSISATGDIRYTGTTNNYTVIELHRWLGDLMDDAQASGNDILDITDSTASERATDNLITLNSPYNIDDTAAQHLYDGSIVQSNGNEVWDGIVCFAPAGTPLQILQSGKSLSPNFWDTGLNADAGNGISHRFMVKVRTAAADIDSRRLVGLTRDVGFTYSDFTINATSRGNNVLALTYAVDLNNSTIASTILSWTSITNTEGYRLLDVNNDTTDEPYYSEWNRDSFTINQLYERAKWLSRTSTAESTCADTGTDFQLANATITGQSQSFANGVNNQFCTRIRVNLRKVGTPTGTLTATIKAHSGTFGTSSIPTGAALATSNSFDTSTLTTAYRTYELNFATPFEMVASTNYVLTLEHAVIDGSNYIEIEGLAGSGTAAGNRSQEVSATWTPTAGDDLAHIVFASAVLYELPGEWFRGVTHQIAINSPSGTFEAVEPVSWTGGTGQMLAIDSTTAGTLMWIQLLTGVAPSGTLTITGTSSGATAATNTTVTSRTLSNPFLGASTGSALIGAYGVGVETADLTASDRLTDLTGTLRIPPNNVVFTVNGLVSGEDRVLVAPLGYEFAFDGETSGPFELGETLTFTSPAGTGYLSRLTDNTDNTGRMNIRLLTGDIPTDNSTISGGTSGASGAVSGAVANSEDSRQLALATTLSGVAETALVCTNSIPTDTPSTGTVRVQLNSAIFRVVPYDSYTSATFTLGTAANAAVQIDVVATAGTFTRASGSFLTDGFFVGMSFTGANFTNGGNNAQFTVATVTALVITVVDNTGMVNETGSGDETLTSDGHDFVTDNATGGAGETGNNVYVSYIDRLATGSAASFTSVYLADRSLFIRVRDGGTAGDLEPIKTFESSGVLGSAGGTSTAIRTSDE